FFFFFQAEDGIRDFHVTGVQTCLFRSTVKLGFLNSTSGPMAISEQTVRDSLILAAEEINADGGIMGKQIEYVEEDGQSEPTVFRSEEHTSELQSRENLVCRLLLEKKK